MYRGKKGSFLALKCAFPHILWYIAKLIFSRYHKCLSCYEKLMSIKSLLVKKQSMPGKLGASFRELCTVINNLDLWKWAKNRHFRCCTQDWRSSENEKKWDSLGCPIFLPVTRALKQRSLETPQSAKSFKVCPYFSTSRHVRAWKTFCLDLDLSFRILISLWTRRHNFYPNFLPDFRNMKFR